MTLTGDDARTWFWEGNVQARVASYLAHHGWTVTRQADTAIHQRGKDIEATIASRRLWVTVKGYPAGTERTRAAVQARHWFSHAMFDVIAYRNADPEVVIAVAFPDVPRYRRSAEMVTWFQAAAPFSFIWVSESGECSVEPPL